MAHAWLPGARRVRAEIDGGPPGGGAPRAVWLTLGSIADVVSVQSAAQRLIGECRPCHLIWDPQTGEVAQLISVLRAGRALGAPDRLDWGPDRVRPRPENVNAEGRVCVQIGVLASAVEPFTDGPLVGAEAIVNWLDSWGIPRRWPAGRPASVYSASRHDRRRAPWARGGHFGASQVPGCEHAGPGAIDTDRLTGTRMLTMSDGNLPASLAEAAALAVTG